MNGPELRFEIAGFAFADWTSAGLQRSLSEISGGFDLEYDDQLRMQTTIPRADARMGLVAIKPGSRPAFCLTVSWRCSA